MVQFALADGNCTSTLSVPGQVCSQMRHPTDQSRGEQGIENEWTPARGHPAWLVRVPRGGSWERSLNCSGRRHSVNSANNSGTATTSAIASIDASFDSNSSPHATANSNRTSKHSSRSRALGYTFSYMSAQRSCPNSVHCAILKMLVKQIPLSW